MQENQMRATSLDAVAAEQQRFMVRVYNWMGAGYFHNFVFVVGGGW